MTFADVLIKKNLVSARDVAALSEKAREENISFEKLLEAHGISPDDILVAKGEAMGVPTLHIKKEDIPFEILQQIPEEASRHYKFIPLGTKAGVMQVGMVDPADIEAREALQFIVSRLGATPSVVLISESDFDTVMGAYHGAQGEAGKVMDELNSALIDRVGAQGANEKTNSQREEEESQNRFVEDTPVTKMVAVILKHASSGNASDIHIEPQKDRLKVRFRVDGVLYTSLMLPLDAHDPLVSRIKILTNMKLDEKRKPQDGRFEATIENRQIDFRVSTMPTFYGEKVVLRLLDKTRGLKRISEIGLDGRNLDVVQRAAARPHGLILITGPTGSGKSTTLYSMLQEIDKEKRNVVTLEDPVEYNMDGVNQSQVHPEIGYDFANGLRSILRQDPDVIMVGEIRDKETAALAIQAALTGHLVISTLHTNSAMGVVPRLIDMGVDPFLIAPTLLLAMGQRLVRVLCPDSRKEIPIIGTVKDRIEREFENIPENLRGALKVPKVVYEGAPSVTCPKGAKGRMAVFEVIEGTPELEEVILKTPVEPEVFKVARGQGMLTMREDGLRRVFDGIIGVEELNSL